MQLRGKESVDLGLIERAESRHTRDASYDLSVEKVIVEGEIKALPFTLKSQHMCIIVSRERVSVKGDLVAFSQPKTELCRYGLLVLSTGIIDPGYNGPLSTTAINFSQEPIEIRSDDTFLRITFHELKKSPEHPSPSLATISDTEYLSGRTNDSKRYPKTFLDIPRHLKEFTQEFYKEVLTVAGAGFQRMVAMTALAFALALGVGGVWFNWANKQDNKKSVDEIRALVAMQLTNTNIATQINDALHQHEAAIANMNAELNAFKSTNYVSATNLDLVERQIRQLESTLSELKQKLNPPAMQK